MLRLELRSFLFQERLAPAPFLPKDLSDAREGPQAAFALRPRGGKPQVTDGPYAEAKEMVGGFFIIEAADRDEAVRVASLHPAATLGENVGWAIELHPIGFFEQAFNQ